MRIDMLGPFSVAVAACADHPERPEAPPDPGAARPPRRSGRPGLRRRRRGVGAAAAPKAHITVQTYVLQLRTFIGRALGDPRAARDVLVTRPGSYALLVGEGAVDVHTYDRLCAQGQSAFETGDDTAAAARFREALALWKGRALDGVQDGPALGLEAMRLEQSRTDVLERCLTAELRLGAGERLLPELSALAEEHPHHEALHGLLMTALARSGRLTRALTVYDTVAARLDERFGLLPSPDLQRLGEELRERAGQASPTTPDLA